MASSISPKKEERLAHAIKTPQELVHIKHKITLRQYKYWVLMLEAYHDAYKRGERSAAGGFHRLSIAEITKRIGYEPVKAELRDDLEAIRREPIVYNMLGKDGKELLRGAGFISEWELSSNWVGFKLPTFLRESVENLDTEGSIFHQLNWAIFNAYTGKYEAILYKLCKDYVGVNRTPYIPLDKFREYMGLRETEYLAFKDLNKFVLSGPAKRLNENKISDITIEVDLRKESRRVVGVQFFVFLKEQTAMDFGDDPAFRFARVDIPVAQQRRYLDAKPPELIEAAIERANEYADELEKKGQKPALGAIYRKAIEQDWGIEHQSKKALEAEKTAAATERLAAEARVENKKRIEELQADFRRLATTAAIKARSPEERRAHFEAYANEEGKGKIQSYNPAKEEFADPVERSRYTGWLRANVNPVHDPEAFATWLQQEKGLNPKTLGL